jgi:hypothetical protein
MKKTRRPSGDDLRAEYDFASLHGGVRGKYAESLRRGSNVVLLEPDVAAVFPTANAVNEALRAVIQASKVMRRARPRPSEKLQGTALARRR